MTSRDVNIRHKRPYIKVSKNPTHSFIHLRNRILESIKRKLQKHYTYCCHRSISKILTPADAKQKDKTRHVIKFTPPQIETIFQIQIKFFYFKIDFFLLFISILTSFGYFRLPF